MEVSGQLHATATLPQVNSCQYPLDRRLGGAQSRSGRGEEEKQSIPVPSGIRAAVVQSVVRHFEVNILIT